MMKKTSAQFLLSALVLLGCLLSPMGRLNIQPAQEAATPGQITVIGQAVVKVVPDEVVLTMGVETFHAQLGVAKRRNDDAVRRAITTAERFGIETKQIQTDFITIEPIYEDDYWRRQVQGYLVRKNIVITLRDITKFDNLLTALIEEGVNYVHGIDFRTTELRKYRDQARALAINAAQEKAAALAKELGREVGDALTIQENQSGWWSWYGYGWWGYSGGMAYQNVVQNAGNLPADFEGTIAPGQISIEAQIAVTFSLKQ
jgi:uncharacterized protein YggE